MTRFISYLLTWVRQTLQFMFEVNAEFNII